MIIISGFRELIKIRLNIETNSPQKSSVSIFIGPNSVSRAKDIVAFNYVTQAVVRVGSKIEP